jgi:hypothetical protein
MSFFSVQWQAMQPLPAPVMRATSRTVVNSPSSIASCTSPAVTLRQRQTMEQSIKEQASQVAVTINVILSRLEAGLNDQCGVIRSGQDIETQFQPDWILMIFERGVKYFVSADPR